MVKQILFILITITFVTTSFTKKSFAQQQNGDIEAFVEDTKSDILIVVAGGLAGAVLGLSTLSFVEEPKAHSRNIIVGSSLGIIAGVSFVAYNQASKSKEMFYNDQVFKRDGVKFDTMARVDWHYNIVNSMAIKLPLPQFGYTFSY